MRLHSLLPLNRWLQGLLTVEDDLGSVVAGPWPCRGKADSQDAANHGNPERYPTQPFGDHPYGAYQIAAVEPDKQPPRTFGPCFLLLDPISGDALKAKQNGRVGIGAHGGDLGVVTTYGNLRATDGCLRTTNEAIAAIEAMSPQGWTYLCEELKS